MSISHFSIPRPSDRLDDIPGYGRGRAGQTVSFRHRLGSNEAPDAPSPSVQAAVAAAFAGVNRYPDLRGETLSEALVRRHGLSPDAVAVGAGSIVILDQLIRAWCDPGDEVVTPWRSYEAYPILAALAGARMVEVPLDGSARLDPAKLLAAVGPRCRVVLICNPNNPTGTALSEDAIDALLASLPQDVLVILDEAYADYAGDAADVAARLARRLSRHANLAVLRTFSKAWGLAGMRVGYCLADPRIIAAVHAVQPPFPLPTPALAAALASLAEPEAVAARVATNATERARLSDGLVKTGLPVADSAANFIWLPVGDDAERLTAHLAAAGIAVRCFAGEGVRITTGTAVDTDAVLGAAAGWDARNLRAGSGQNKGS
ncbi:histidinol-phosphate transaminase [Defluviimonas sp. SAOS-178_SWC]|uniref:histidinol-phosphate transaminase n=1 Tax=Defluviimonas sp. SAOS-178_SWC TaxID=3121287 RepID=UPI003221AB89